MTNPSEAIIEAVARAIYAEAQAEALRVHPTDQPLPSFDEDEEHSRAFCFNMARAAICAMRAICKRCDQEFDIVTGHACSGQAATNPSEAMIEAGRKAWREITHGLVDLENNELAAIYAAMQQAATPAAPVQDDDAEELRITARWLREHSRVRWLTS